MVYAFGLFGLFFILILILELKEYKKASQTGKKRIAGFWKGRLRKIFILGILFFGFFIFIVYPTWDTTSIKARGERAEKIVQIIDSIQGALATYAKKNPEIGYPHQISDYDDLRDIVNQYGGALPENQSEIFIKIIHYDSDSGKDYKMDIEIDNQSFIITPNALR